MNEASTPEAAGHACPVDVEWLKECTGDDADAMKALVDLYIKCTGAQIEELDAALKNNSAADVGRIAHSCLSSSGACGMATIVPLVKELERKGKSGNLEGAAAWVDSFRVEFSRARKFLRENKMSSE